MLEMTEYSLIDRIGCTSEIDSAAPDGAEPRIVPLVSIAALIVGTNTEMFAGPMSSSVSPGRIRIGLVP